MEWGISGEQHAKLETTTLKYCEIDFSEIGRI
jgi:hypothetical protein